MQRKIRKMPTGLRYFTQKLQEALIPKRLVVVPNLMFDHKSPRRYVNLNQNLNQNGNQTKNRNQARMQEKSTNGRVQKMESIIGVPS